jgi:hypothetical protein
MKIFGQQHLQFRQIFLTFSKKALADYVYVHKKDWIGLKPVTESLRIEPEEFESVTLGDIELLIDNYTNRRVQKFIKGLKKDLKL